MAVQRVLNLLHALASPEAPLSLARLSALLAAPKPSVFSLLTELTALGYVRRVEHGFELGALAYRLGLQITAVDSVGSVIRGALLDLNAKLGMTVAFGYLDRERKALIYADRCEALGAVRYVVSLGMPLAIHSRALGRLLLSYEPEDAWTSWLGEEPYAKFTRYTTTRFARLAPGLKRMRREGIARTDSEQHEGIGSYAMPVVGADGAVACGIATQTMVVSLDAHGAKVIAAMQETAALLGSELASRGITRESLPSHI